MLYKKFSCYFDKSCFDQAEFAEMIRAITKELRPDDTAYWVKRNSSFYPKFSSMWLRDAFADSEIIGLEIHHEKK